MDFCDNFEAGCYPSEIFGFRGFGCNEACLVAAEDGTCAEALIELTVCRLDEIDAASSCLPLDSNCSAKALRVATACDGFAPIPVSPDEETFCAAFTGPYCACGDLSFRGEICEETTRNECVAGAWAREPCRAATEDFITCVEGLAACDRRAVSETCQDLSTARNIVCP